MHSLAITIDNHVHIILAEIKRSQSRTWHLISMLLLGVLDVARLVPDVQVGNVEVARFPFAEVGRFGLGSVAHAAVYRRRQQRTAVTAHVAIASVLIGCLGRRIHNYLDTCMYGCVRVCMCRIRG